MDDDELSRRLKNDRFPRSANYSARWTVDNSMGPNPVWLAEWLCEVMPLEPGMRVLDMGCGKATSSIFLAKEFGVDVWATDLWIEAGDNWSRVCDAGLQGRVHPVHAEAHTMPFAEGFFDALFSIGTYHYFGTDELYLGTYSSFVKPGGAIGIVVPGVVEEQETLPPPHLAKWWPWNFCAFHTPEWWRRNWERTGLVTVEVADLLEDGWRHWLQWDEVCDIDRQGEPDWESDMLREDAGRVLGLTRVLGHRLPE